MKSDFVCHDNHSEANPHGCTGHFHGPELQDTSGPTLLITLVLKWIPGAAVLGNLLLLAFFTALLFNLARGMDVSCGCFSTAPGENGAGYLTVLRDLSFLLVSGYLFHAEFLMASRMPAAGKALLQKRA